MKSYCGTFPTQDEVNVLGDAVGNDWAARMDADHTLGNYIVAVGLGSGVTMGFNIVPEIGGFETNLDDPSQCGPVAL